MTTNKPTTAPEFLAQAGAIMAQRAAQYDQPGGERSMGRTVEAFNIVTGHKLSEADGWLLMQLLKDVRQWQTPGKFHRDSAEDGVAYSALKAEALARGEVKAAGSQTKHVLKPSVCEYVGGVMVCAWARRKASDTNGTVDELCVTCGATRPVAP